MTPHLAEDAFVYCEGGLPDSIACVMSLIHTFYAEEAAIDAVEKVLKAQFPGAFFVPCGFWNPIIWATTGDLNMDAVKQVFPRFGDDCDDIMSALAEDKLILMKIPEGNHWGLLALRGQEVLHGHGLQYLPDWASWTPTDQIKKLLQLLTKCCR